MRSMKLGLLAVVLLALSSAASAQQMFKIWPDSTGKWNSGVRGAPAYVDVRVLAPNVSETHTVPTGYNTVLFSSNCDFFAKSGASAAVPAADVTDGTGSELNPATWNTTGITQLTVISSSACTITLSWYRVQP